MKSSKFENRYLGCLWLVFGLGASSVAEFNLYGVPMLERNAMNPTIGCIALVVAVGSLACAYLSVTESQER